MLGGSLAALSRACNANNDRRSCSESSCLKRRRICKGALLFGESGSAVCGPVSRSANIKYGPIAERVLYHLIHFVSFSNRRERPSTTWLQAALQIQSARFNESCIGRTFDVGVKLAF